MALSADLISQFAKVVSKKETRPESVTVNGTAKSYSGKIYVQIDGSNGQLTPIASSTVGMKDGDRVTVQIKNHSATITGNATDPSAGKSYADDISNKVDEVIDQISEFEIVVADKVSTTELDAQKGRIDNLVSDNVTIKEKLTATEANIGTLTADNILINDKLTANNATIENLQATKLDVDIADIKFATVSNLEATNADIHNLTADYGEFKQLSTDKFTASEAAIRKLDVEKINATDAELKFANIDFANIGKAAVENFFSKSGMIGDLVVGDGTITGTLVGVTIKGDLIEGGTVKADKLVVQGEDGLYYKLNVTGETVSSEQTEYNSLNGSIITAKSVTAEKISVNDLVAFGATIGGFHITENSLYSGVKESIDNTTRGTFMNDDGEFSIGDGSNFLKFFKDSDGTYKLAISASSIKLGASGTSIEDLVGDTKLTDQKRGYIVEIGQNAGKPPIHTTLFGDTRQNFWTNPPSATKKGVVYTSNKDGSMSISGESTGETTISSVYNYELKPGSKYTITVDRAISSGTQAYLSIRSYAGGSSSALTSVGSDSLGLSKTFTVPSNSEYVSMVLYSASAGMTNGGEFHVMLSEGSGESEWCPPGINGVNPTSIIISSSKVAEDGVIIPLDMQGYALYATADTKDELHIDASGNVMIVQNTKDGAPVINLGRIELPGLNKNHAYVWVVSDIPSEIDVKYWTPLGEAVADVQTESNNADKNITNVITNTIQPQINKATLDIDGINAAISSLVTDANGESLMIQTPTGWTFNMSSIQSSVDKAISDIDTIHGDIVNIDNLVEQANSIINDITKKTAYINMTTDERGDPCIELGKSDNDFKLRITNTSMDFMQGTEKIAYLSNHQLYIQSSVVTDELRIGAETGYIWKKRGNNHLGLRYISE